METHVFVLVATAYVAPCLDFEATSAVFKDTYGIAALSIAKSEKSIELECD